VNEASTISLNMFKKGREPNKYIQYGAFIKKDKD
jgi:hypothetical protein